MGVVAIFLLNDYLNTHTLTRDLKQTLKEQEEDIKKLQQSLDTLKCDYEKKLGKKKERMKGLDEKIKKKQQEIDTLRSGYEKMLKEKRKRDREINEEITNKQQEIDTLRSDYKKMLEEKEKRDWEVDQKIKQQQQAFDTLKCDYEKKLGKKKERIKGLDEEIKKKQQEIDTLRSDYQEMLKEKEKRIQSMDEEIKRKQQENDTLRIDYQEMLKEKETRIQSMDEEIKKKQQENDALKSDIQNMLKEKEDQTQTMEKEIQNKQLEIDTLRSEYQEMSKEKETRIQSLDEEIKKKHQENDALKSDIQNMLKEKEDQAQTMEKEIENKQLEIDTLRSEYQETLKEKETHIQSLDEEIKKKQQENDTLTRDNEKMLKENEERIKKMVEQIKKKEQENDTLTSDHKKMLEEKGEQIQKMVEEMRKKKQENGTLKSEYKKMLKEKEKIEKEMDEEITKKQQEIKKLNLAEKELIVVREELKASDVEAKSMKEFVDTLKSNFEEMLKKKEQHIKTKDEEIKKNQQEIENLRDLQQKDKENKEHLEREIAKCNKKIEDLEKEKNVLVNKMKGYQDCLQEVKKFKYNSYMANLICPMFEKNVDPSQLISAIHKYDHWILTRTDIERVLAEQKNEGPSLAAAKLLRLLCWYEGWFPCLMKALRDPEIKRSYVADHAESALDQVNDEKKREYLNSAKQSQGEHQMEFCFHGDIDSKKRTISCQNKAKHDKFTTLSKFHLELLPQNWRFEVMGDLIKAAGHLTVKVTSNYISDRRPQGYPLHDLGGLCGLLRIGGGMVWTLKRKFSTQDQSFCQCHECFQGNKKRRQWGEYVMFTDRHLIYDDEEAYFATLTVTFDNGNGTVKTEQLFPVSCHATEDDKDYIEITCVTHDEQAAGKLEKDLNQYTKNLNEIGKINRFIRNQETREAMKCIIIFYSHGLEKGVTVGDITDPKLLRYKALTCPGSTGAPVFVLGDCFERGKYVSTTTHSTYNMTSGIGQSCTWRR